MTSDALLYPVIGEREEDESPIRLFDQDIVEYLRDQYDTMLTWYEKQLADYKAELAEASVPGFRYPNPDVDIPSSIEYLKKKIAEYESDIAAEKANPMTWDNISFEQQVSEQCWLVGMTAPPDEAMTIQFEAYIRKVTAKAAVIKLWIDLKG